MGPSMRSLRHALDHATLLATTEPPCVQRLLTAGSLVRIRPGEPNENKGLCQPRLPRRAPNPRFGNAAGNIAQISPVMARDWPYAVHEAGHAVVAWALKQTVRRVWIDPENQVRPGGTDAGWPDDPLSYRAICLAGIEAIKILNVVSCGPLGDDDNLRFLNSASGASEADYAILKGEAEALACKHLSKHLEMLKQVAAALAKHRSLDQAAFTTIAEQHGFPA
jgi:hypothetical protein